MDNVHVLRLLCKKIVRNSMNQIEFYEAKLKYEIDSWDLSEAIKNNDSIIVVDARSNEAYTVEHIPSAVSIPHKFMSIETTKDLEKS